MSIQLYVRDPQERHFRTIEPSRTLIRTCEPPDSPAIQGVCCDAVETDGQCCRQYLPSETQIWCTWHSGELSELHARWEKLQRQADSIQVISAHTAKQKVLKLRLAVELRRRIRERFHSRGADTVDFIAWIAKLEKDVRALANTALMSSLNGKHLPDSPCVRTPRSSINASENILILQSPLEPGIPIVSLQSMPDDGTILVLKHFSTDLCADAIRRLYSILPDLHFSSAQSDSPVQDQNLGDTGVDIVCSWFRIMILNDSDADTLERATRARSIGEFLAGCQASQIEMYCEFFDKAWRPHAIQYLRVAICAQTLAGGDMNSVKLLGGLIPSTSEGLQMTKPCWDILYRWFPTLLTPWTIASICSNFEDYSTICKLLMLGLYREHWYDPASILNECATGVYFGFIPLRKGDFTNHSPLSEFQSESRNYLCGQMAIGDPMTQCFLDELRKRKDRLYLVVYEGTNVDATVHPTEPDLFIKRRRSLQLGGDAKPAEWTTMITLEDVKNDLRLRKSSMYDPIVVDSWQFIIIDRNPGMPFELIDIVQDALLMLAGDPSPRKVARRVVREVIPPTVQDIYLEEMTIECSSSLRFPPPPLGVQYEGHRYRCSDPNYEQIRDLRDQKAMETPSRDDNRLIRRLVEDMERSGLITLMTEHEPAQTRPVIVQGADGAQDLYFPYDHDNSTVMMPKLSLPSSTCLLEFASAFKQQYPNAIMAKGSIQTHYCAWPMPVIKSLGNIGLNFATHEGHIYRWNAMPFDRPWSANAWQYYIQHCINSRYPFVMFYLTTFVICAVDREDAYAKSEMLLEETDDRGWRIVLPRPNEWKSSLDDLRLDTLFEGIRPA